jgi:hypothetical protein
MPFLALADAECKVGCSWRRLRRRGVGALVTPVLYPWRRLRRRRVGALVTPVLHSCAPPLRSPAPSLQNRGGPRLRGGPCLRRRVGSGLMARVLDSGDDRSLRSLALSLQPGRAVFICSACGGALVTPVLHSGDRSLRSSLCHSGPSRWAVRRGSGIWETRVSARFGTPLGHMREVALPRAAARASTLRFLDTGAGSGPEGSAWAGVARGTNTVGSCAVRRQ